MDKALGSQITKQDPLENHQLFLRREVRLDHQDVFLEGQLSGENAERIHDGGQHLGNRKIGLKRSVFNALFQNGRFYYVISMEYSLIRDVSS